MYKNKTAKIVELRGQLSTTHVPMLSAEDHEDVSDRYQEALEIGYYKQELRDEIEAIKLMSYAEFDEVYNPKPEVKHEEPEYGYLYENETGDTVWTDDYEQSIGE